MIGKAMRFATVCTLAFAICGKASRDNVAAVSKGTTEDLEPSQTSSCSGVQRLAVILAAVTYSDALEVRPFQKDSNTAFAPILTNNPLDGTHDMLRAANANRANFAPNFATPQVFPHDIKLNANRAQAQNKMKEYSSSQVALLPLDDPTPADRLAFSRLNKQKDCRPTFFSSTFLRNPPQFNVLEEYTRQAECNFLEELNLSPEEKAALCSYANKDKNLINQIARGAGQVVFKDSYYVQGVKTDITCILTQEDMLPWLKFLNAGLKKMPSAAGRLYRGVGFNVEGTPGSIAPITGFSSFSEDFDWAECFVEQKRKDGIQPTIFVMDTHSSGHQLDQIGEQVVFPVGTKFVIVEDKDGKVQQEVELLWWWKEKVQREASQGERMFIEGMLQPDFDKIVKPFFNMFAKPDFKVLVVKEVLSDSELALGRQPSKRALWRKASL